ncbi:MAG: ATP-binding cassette domain-containing protein, partial [Candidatus Omnitrophica bacterium]|nr:ATP-binding cassette domain-containing protein [Candidatus Omnitrophota bacterium]
YLQDFLFTPDRARTPAKVLSGGERNRLLLARLFTQPSNFLVMDEPTNDLDIETQELLEELLMDFPGTVILVSHDRVFLNNVVASTIVLEGDGEVYEYPGGYDDWLSQRKEKEPKITHAVTKSQSKNSSKSSAKRKLSFKEKEELKRLPDQIQKLEGEQEELYALLADVAFYQKDPKKVARVQARDESIVDELLELYQRWEELEDV